MDFDSLELGDIVTITLNSFNRLMGELSAIIEQPKIIALKNVRYLYNESQVFGKKDLKSDIIFNEISIEWKNIIKLVVASKEKKDCSSLVPAGNSSFGLNAKTPPLNSLLGRKCSISLLYKGNVKKELEQSMQDFCKNIFESINFSKLLSQSDKNVDIGLPKYVVTFTRHPMSITEELELNSLQQDEQPTSDVKNSNQAEQPLPVGQSLYQEEQATPIEENSFPFGGPVHVEQNVDDEAENYGGFRGNNITLEELFTPMEECPFFTVTPVNFDDDDDDDFDDAVDDDGDPYDDSQFLYNSSFRLSPFLRYSNGELHLNDDYEELLCESPRRVDTGDGEPLIIQDITNLVLNCQAMGKY